MLAEIASAKVLIFVLALRQIETYTVQKDTVAFILDVIPAIMA